jgi:hypothetical protein
LERSRGACCELSKLVFRCSWTRPRNQTWKTNRFSCCRLSRSPIACKFRSAPCGEWMYRVTESVALCATKSTMWTSSLTAAWNTHTNRRSQSHHGLDNQRLSACRDGKKPAQCSRDASKGTVKRDAKCGLLSRRDDTARPILLVSWVGWGMAGKLTQLAERVLKNCLRRYSWSVVSRRVEKFLGRFVCGWFWKTLYCFFDICQRVFFK